MKTIVHVLSLSAIGGVQNSFIPYIKLAKSKSMFNHQICLTRRIGDDYSNELGEKFYYLKTFRGILKLIFQIYSNQFIIHFYNSLGSKPIKLLLNFFPHSNIIFHERGSAWNSNSLNHKNFIKNSKHASIIVTNSRATKSYLNLKFNIPKDKIKVIYNGIVVKKKVYKKVNQHSKKISVGFLGRFETQKGIPTLISAAKLLPNINFYFGGYGPWEKFIYENSKLNKNIILLGKINNPTKFLSNIDILVVPSIREPFGNVIVEAGILGKTVIASNVDGIPEIINSDKVGVLITPKEPVDKEFRPLNSLNYPEKIYDPISQKLTSPLLINSNELKEVIEKISLDKNLRKNLGKNLQMRVESVFSLEEYYLKLERLYKIFNVK